MTGTTGDHDAGRTTERANPPDGPRWLPGKVAAAGLAIGPIVNMAGSAPDAATGGSQPPDQARQRLDAAIAEAKRQLDALRRDADEELAGEVLGFQLALLDDPELLEPAEPVFARGEGAAAAWEAAIGDLIQAYAEDSDEYFRARADDLRDLRQRVLDALAGAPTADRAVPEDAVLIARSLSPSRFLEIDWSRARGAALTQGSATSHMAMLARARGVPLLTGLGEAAAELAGGGRAVLDAVDGYLVVDPDEPTRHAYRDRLDRRAAEAAADARHRDAPARTADGTPVTVQVNVDDPEVLGAVAPDGCDGVGLTRTEFLFRDGPADEETQLAAYRRILAWADGRPVTVRTLDAGGDKPVPGVTADGESNPFLGLRGLRLSLARPELFRTQLRALLRAAADGPLKIMLPMVTLPREIDAARAGLAAAREALAQEGVDVPAPHIGMMVETPAAALRPMDFDVDFYSIGTNDLVQYVMAAARDVESVADLQEPTDPGVLELIARVADAGRERGVEVSVCGEMAARPDGIPALLDAGVRNLSVPPSALGRTKRAVAAHRLRAGDG